MQCYNLALRKLSLRGCSLCSGTAPLFPLTLTYSWLQAPLSTSGTPLLGSEFVCLCTALHIEGFQASTSKEYIHTQALSHPYSKPICLSALFSQQSDSTIYNTFLNWRLNSCLHFPSQNLFTLLLSFPLSFMKTS